MRIALLTAALISLATPGLAADYWQSDNLLACLVGKGAVEMRHGSSAADALHTVEPTCQAVADPPPADAGNAADYTDYVKGTALQILQQAASVI